MVKIGYFFIIFILILQFACSSEVGDSCEVDTDCESGQVCEDEFPGGYCIKYSCDINNSESCPDESQCTLFKDINRTFCLKKCNSNSDCRSNYSCTQIENNEYKVCLPEE